METELIVATFDTMTGADAMLETLKDLQDDDFIELLDAVIVTKDLKGRVEVRQPLEVGPGRGAAFGALTGAVVGLLGGPAGAIVGLVSGAVTGGSAAAAMEAALPKADIKAHALAELNPGESALLVYFDEVWLDTIEQAALDLGASIIRPIVNEVRKAEREQQAELRKERIDAAYKSWQEKLDTQKAALTALRQRSAAALQADRSALQQQIEQTNHRIETTHQNILHRLQVWQQQIDADIKAAEAEIKQSNAKVKADLEQRIAADNQARQALRSKVKETLSSRLDHAKSEVDSLKAQAAQADEQRKAKLNERITQLQADIAAAQQRFDDWEAAGDAAWDAHEKLMDEAIASYWHTFDEIENDYEKYTD